MSFYDNYSFFICLVVALIPAIVLGVRQRRIAPYGLAISLLFLVALFSQTPTDAVFFAGFVIAEMANVLIYVRRRNSGAAGRAHYAIALAIAIAPLFIYKVTVAAGNGLLGFIGISYITFKVVQMVLETHDGLIKEMAPVDCLYFLVFFPTFTSGPIDRSRRFIEDIHKKRSRAEYLDMLGRGISFLIIGLLYSVVLAAICKKYYTPVSFAGFGSPDMIKTIRTSLITSVAYAGYLFFDFAGYSFMARGVGFCLGVEVPQNFRAPFRSLDIKDFWNRWHMTLSFWLRDFVFMRFSMHSVKHHLFKSRLTTACCGYIINMTLMGCWHGLTLDYILYGVYHGILLALTDVYQKKSGFHKRHKKQVWYKGVCWLVTMILVIFGFSIFSGQFATFLGRRS